jgi:hypothetical protein
MECGQFREDRVSGYYNQSDSDDFDGVADNSGGGLRKLLEDTLAENKRLREAIEGGSREKAVTDLLKDKGLDPAVASVIPKDADPAEWLGKNGHLFVSTKSQVEDEAKPEAEAQSQAAQQANEAHDAERAAREQMAEAEASGYAVVTQSDLERVEAMSAEDLLAEIAKSQAVNG